MRLLARAGLVRFRRGSRGGYYLAEPAQPSEPAATHGENHLALGVVADTLHGLVADLLRCTASADRGAPPAHAVARLRRHIHRVRLAVRSLHPPGR